MNLISKIKYTHDFSLLHRLIFLLKYKRRNAIETEELIDICNQYKSISILASGPSLNKCKIQLNTLYFTTNSSYLYLNKSSNFIHIIKDYGYLKKFLMFGLKYKPKLVIIEVFTHTNGRGFGEKSIDILNKYFGKIRFNYPVIITNNENIIDFNNKNYYNNRTNWINKYNIVNPDSNSGLMLYGYALWLSNIGPDSKTMNVYGLDAGEGGQKYYNKDKTPRNHVAMRDKNKKEMGRFIDKCQGKFKNIKNFSYFKSNS